MTARIRPARIKRLRCAAAVVGTAGAIAAAGLLSAGGSTVADLAATSAPSTSASSSPAPSSPAPIVSPGDPAGDRSHISLAGTTASNKGGIFTELCGYVDTASIDPILMPGMTGMSMSHDFFGSRSVTASSTPASLAGGPTSCRTSADSSAYWAPTLYQNGVAVTPLHAILYWRQSAANAAAVQTMPAGLTMIAGNEHATAPQGLGRVRWTCGAGTVTTTTPHDCPTGDHIRVAVIFPYCWDGTTLDGAAQTNVVYPIGRTGCPADHPHVLPQLIVHLEYPTASAAGLTLSTGPGTTSSTDSEHVDFMNAFSPTPLAADVAKCLTGDITCGRVTGPDAVPGLPPGG